MIKYCPRCHKEAYRLKRENGKVEIMQNGRTLLNLGDSNNIGTISVSCPNGHLVRVMIKGESDEDKD